LGDRELTTSIVAGASGFLGSHLCLELIKQGHKVIGIDNYSTSDSSRPFIPEGVENYEHFKADVVDASTWPAFGEIDFVFHFGSPASPPKYQVLGLETLHANTRGTENLIELALAKSARFIYASTSEVYGDPLEAPQSETYFGNVNPIGPRSVYDESKRLGETLVFHYIRAKGLDGAVARIFNTYGPGMDPWDGRVVSSLIRQGCLGEPFTIFGDGMQTRSFCFVEDLIRGIVRLALSSETGPMNLGSSEEVTIVELAEQIASILQIEPVWEFHPLPQDDPIRRRPDISLAKERLGWEPQVGRSQGISLTAEWVKSVLGPHRG
jgi:nucleoside-diphosphate-sugar epimerase